MLDVSQPRRRVVDGARVIATDLADGDTIRLGPFALSYMIGR